MEVPFFIINETDNYLNCCVKLSELFLKLSNKFKL
jgi:hypothetical protein